MTYWCDVMTNWFSRPLGVFLSTSSARASMKERTVYASRNFFSRPARCAPLGLGESSFLLLEYSAEYLTEYSSTGQGKSISKSVYIRRQRARVTRQVPCVSYCPASSWSLAGQSLNWFASSQARLNLSSNCVTNVCARGLPVFIAV